MSRPPGKHTGSDPITPELVLKWLHAVWPKATSYPDRKACWFVATMLRWIRDYRGIRKSPPPSEAPKYARLFVRHAPRLLAHLTGRAEASRLRYDIDQGGLITDEDAYARAMAVVAQVDEAARKARAAVAALEASGMMAPWRPAQPERLVHDAVQDAWRLAAEEDEQVRVPQSKAAEHPLCAFVQVALAEIGIKEPLATISSVLRGERRK